MLKHLLPAAMYALKESHSILAVLWFPEYTCQLAMQCKGIITQGRQVQAELLKNECPVAL